MGKPTGFRSQRGLGCVTALATRVVLALLASAAVATPAMAAPRFAVVNLSGRDAPAAVVSEIEREVARLRPGYEPIEEPALRKLITTGEQPLDAVIRLIATAEDRRNAGDCAAAVEALDEAEALTLEAVSLDDERAPLKRIYTARVVCEHTLGRPEARDRYAHRLRALVSLRPDDMPESVWQEHVENATPGEPAVELQIDSEPPNAQVQINFHGDGVTPRTLKVPRGEVIVEVQKEGYKKAFRRLVMDDVPRRTVFRLVDRRRDRVDLTAAAMRLLSEVDPRRRPRTLANLAQWLRAELLVLVRFEGDQVRIWQFDAERGALAKEVIESTFDAETGAVKALAERATPQPGDAPAPQEVAAATEGESEEAAGLPSTFEARPRASRRRRPDEEPTPWWGWAIAAAIGAGVVALAFSDRTSTADDLDVRATYTPSP